MFVSPKRAHSSWGRIALYVHDLPETAFIRGEITHGSKMAKTKNGEIEILQGRGSKLRGSAVALAGREICAIRAFPFLRFRVPALVGASANRGPY